jgi:hypothetical protein
MSSKMNCPLLTQGTVARWAGANNASKRVTSLGTLDRRGRKGTRFIDSDSTDKASLIANGAEAGPCHDARNQAPKALALLHIDQAVSRREGDRFEPGMDLELRQNPLHMGSDRIGRDRQS